MFHGHYLKANLFSELLNVDPMTVIFPGARITLVNKIVSIHALWTSQSTEDKILNK